MYYTQIYLHTHILVYKYNKFIFSFNFFCGYNNQMMMLLDIITFYESGGKGL